MKTVLITGGAGFIGSTLTDRLLTEGGWNVVCLDSFDDFYDPEQKRRNLRNAVGHPSFRLIEGDICDERLLSEEIDVNPDVVVHLAARAGVRPSILRPRLYERVNTGGTMNLLELARKKKVPHVVFASSSSVYGTNARFPWSESDPVLQPISPYAATKVAGELLGHTYHHLYGMRFIALRIFTVFGPRQRPDLAIHRFFKSITEGRAVPFYGDGTTSRDYTYVDDVVNGIRAAMAYEDSGYEVINLGNNRSVVLSELIEIIEAAAGRKAVRDVLPAQAGDVPHTRADIRKAEKLLNYRPATGMEKGIRQFAHWFLSEKAMAS